MDEIKKIIAAICVTALIGGFSSYVQLATIGTEMRHIQTQMTDINKRLVMVNDNTTELKLIGSWKIAVEATLSELRISNNSFSLYMQQNRERIIKLEYDMEKQK